MKKVIYLCLMMLAAVSFSSCDKEEIGNTSTVALAGEWMVTVDAINADGSILYEDPYELGSFLLLTYNTNADDGKEIWVNDLKTLWNFAVKVPCNIEGLSFGSQTPVENFKYDCGVTLWDGKVTINGTLSPSQMPVDAIEFKVTFDDDDYELTYWVHGYRRTGLNFGEE